ncbi:MAG: DUF427 domain-containing protein [Actinomycetota bacterium]|nr:DUF427 domain-containing protein [Actinomycetota bacterium]
MSGPPQFDFGNVEPRVEPTPRWIRVRAGDQWIADSRNALLYVRYGPGTLPTYCFPDEAVNKVAVESLPDGAAHRFGGGDPAELEGHWTFAWDGRVRWFEEAEEIFVHARDPLHRVDAVASERHLIVEIDGVRLAESRRAHALFETALPTRWYLPPEDVRQDLLSPSDLKTQCPFKGAAKFFCYAEKDIAWTYDDPIAECPSIAGLIAFFNEAVDLTIDGEPQKRPFTPWSLAASG